MKLKLFFLCLVSLCVHSVWAQELAFPSKINFFRYAAAERPEREQQLYGFPDARLWGWSKNGKVAYSVETQIEGRGGQRIDFVILDLINDKVVFELKMDSVDYGDATDEALYNLFKADIGKALKTHAISAEKSDFLQFPIKRNGKNYACKIENVEYKTDEHGFFDKVVSKYCATVTADNKSKIINWFTPSGGITGYVYVCGYFVSPFENRALVILAEEQWGFEGTELSYRFSGCHLGAGFN